MARTMHLMIDKRRNLMRKLMIALFSAALVVGGLSMRVARAAEADSKDKKEAKTVEGELVDTHCYAAGGATGEEHGAKCGKGCAQSGIPVAVLADGKAWTIATNPAPLADAVGKTVRVTGSQNAESQVLVPEKVEVKDGEKWKEITLKDAHHKGGAEGEHKP
jgi:hypothetical protein